jgi:hypothetical protein
MGSVLMKEVVYLYDLSNFRHLKIDGNNFIVGETVYNAQVKRDPVRKYGKAPNALIACYPHWFEMSDAEQSLQTLGFTQKNNIEWEK